MQQAGYSFDSLQMPMQMPLQQPPSHWPQDAREHFMEQQYRALIARQLQYNAPPPGKSPRMRSIDSPRNRFQQWWEGGPRKSMQPPAAVYSNEPLPDAPRTQPNAPVAPEPVVFMNHMPPTPTQRGAATHQNPGQLTPPSQHQYNAMQMAPTPTQHNTINVPGDAYSQQNCVQYGRDPTPRNRIAEFMQNMLPQSNSVPCSPRMSERPFNVAEEIHRVSWGETRRGTETENKHQEAAAAAVTKTTTTAAAPQEQTRASQQLAAAMTSLNISKPTGLPIQASNAPVPPPPPPRQKHQRPPRRSLNGGKGEGVQVIFEKEETVSGPVKFEDLVDENRPSSSNDPKKEGKGRTLLGMFGRNKRKDAKPSPNKYSIHENDTDDGSLISDAVLRDRHDRFVTKI